MPGWQGDAKIICQDKGRWCFGGWWGRGVRVKSRKTARGQAPVLTLLVQGGQSQPLEWPRPEMSDQTAFYVVPVLETLEIVTGFIEDVPGVVVAVGALKIGALGMNGSDEGIQIMPSSWLRLVKDIEQCSTSGRWIVAPVAALAMKAGGQAKIILVGAAPPGVEEGCQLLRPGLFKPGTNHIPVQALATF